jgi:hypothetical protein
MPMMLLPVPPAPFPPYPSPYAGTSAGPPSHEHCHHRCGCDDGFESD